MRLDPVAAATDERVLAERLRLAERAKPRRTAAVPVLVVGDFTFVEAETGQLVLRHASGSAWLVADPARPGAGPLPVWGTAPPTGTPGTLSAPASTGPGGGGGGGGSLLGGLLGGLLPLNLTVPDPDTEDDSGADAP